jgi:hypothetical protein
MQTKAGKLMFDRRSCDGRNRETERAVWRGNRGVTDAGQQKGRDDPASAVYAPSACQTQPGNNQLCVRFTDQG